MEQHTKSPPAPIDRGKSPVLFIKTFSIMKKLISQVLEVASVVLLVVGVFWFVFDPTVSGYEVSSILMLSCVPVMLCGTLFD